MKQNRNSCGEKSGSAPKVEMSFGFFLSLSFFLLMDRTKIASMCVLAVLLHEMGHLVMMNLCGMKVNYVNLTPFGIDIQREESGSLGKEMLVHLSGPVVNLVLAVMFRWIGKGYFSAVNCALGIFQLCPLPSLDGGQALFCATQCVFSLETATKISCLVERTAFALILIVAGILFCREKNFTLLLLLLGLAFSLRQTERKQNKTRKKL